ncbi:MAG: hypothetical protein ACE5I1_24855 [bacterium]
MAKNKRKAEPIPEQFESFEALADFWESHDLSDYDISINPLAQLGVFQHGFLQLALAFLNIRAQNIGLFAIRKLNCITCLPPY